MEIGNGTERGETAGTGNAMGIDLVVAGTTRTMMVVGRRDMMMTDEMSDADATRNLLNLEMMELLVRGGEGAEARMLLLNKGPRRPRDVFRCHREGGRLQDGMYMLQGTSNIRPCRRSKRVRLFLVESLPVILIFIIISGLFNLPGANRTQIPPILGIPGLPTPMPVPTFGMGLGVNPNLSRQSRRLYIGSITPDVNEQNLADFFNSKMVEMSIGTGGPGNPVLAVQCNYEKNYAFIEVS
jgi:hypothetical protein